MVLLFICVNRLLPLDNAVFLYYLCSDILINQSVNPMEWSRQLMSRGANGRQLTTPLLTN